MAKRRRVRWSPEAEQDLLDIWSYIMQAAGASVADAQVRTIDDQAARLAEWPHSGRARDDLFPGLRSILVRSYMVFYRLADRRIEVVRVLHGSRDVVAIFTEPERKDDSEEP
jgi:toxin ParE1/3/4